MNNIQKTIYERNDLDNYTLMISKANYNRIELMRKYLDLVIKGKNSKLKILDFGCADGELFKDLTNTMDFYGVDISETLLEKAENNGYKIFLLDIERSALPFSNDFFDIIIFGETIEHIVNTDWVMCELNRVLKQGGSLIISIPNINQWVSVFMMAFFDLPPRYSARFRAPHVRDFTFKTMKYCLKEFGFSIIKRQGTGIFLPLINKNIFLYVTRLFPRLASEVVFLCKKIRPVLYNKENIVEF